MKRYTTTDRLVTLGMALTADKRAMERRVRGVFARKKSAKATLALALALTLALTAGGFTTACQPGEGKADVQTDRFAEISADLPQQTRAPEPQSIVPAENDLRDIQTTLDSLQETPFAPLSAPVKFQEPRTQIAENVYLSVDADIGIPQTDGYGIRRVKNATFTAQDYQKLVDYFLKGEIVSESMATDGFTLSAKHDGADRIVRGMCQAQVFLMKPAAGVLIREGNLPGDSELEAQYGAEIRKPIPLLREDAQAAAEQTLRDLGISGLALDSAEKACLFDEWNGEEFPVLSRGWDFVFVLDNAGLLLHEYNGGSTSVYDVLNYCSVYGGSLSVYVDETGVALFYWVRYYETGETVYQNVAVLSAEDALALAKERLARLYPRPVSKADGARMEIELYSLRLSASLITDSWNVKPDGSPVPEGLLVPCWDVSCKISDTGDGYVEYKTFPFVAFDGGAVEPLG
ncbi:MAG: DUF6034 family protein [Eubacteriales bacterium]|nr:DUF6034 family protein [Eubacteriales bacterium]